MVMGTVTTWTTPLACGQKPLDFASRQRLLDFRQRADRAFGRCRGRPLRRAPARFCRSAPAGPRSAVPDSRARAVERSAGRRYRRPPSASDRPPRGAPSPSASARVSRTARSTRVPASMSPRCSSASACLVVVRLTKYTAARDRQHRQRCACEKDAVGQRSQDRHGLSQREIRFDGAAVFGDDDLTRFADRAFIPRDAAYIGREARALI